MAKHASSTPARAPELSRRKSQAIPRPPTARQRRKLLEGALDRLLGAVDGLLADLDALDGDPDLEDIDEREPVSEDEGAPCEDEGAVFDAEPDDWGWEAPCGGTNAPSVTGSWPPRSEAL